MFNRGRTQSMKLPPVQCVFKAPLSYERLSEWCQAGLTHCLPSTHYFISLLGINVSKSRMEKHRLCRPAVHWYYLSSLPCEVFLVSISETTQPLLRELCKRYWCGSNVTHAGVWAQAGSGWLWLGIKVGMWVIWDLNPLYMNESIPYSCNMI